MLRGARDATGFGRDGCADARVKRILPFDRASLFSAGLLAKMFLKNLNIFIC